MLPHKGALVLTVDKPELITDAMPNARHVRHKGKELVLVKHNLDSTKVLRNMGLDAPTPMLHDGYDWPGRFEPMSHQVTTADFATINRKLFVLNGTGTGKTAATIWGADYLIKRGYVKRVLVICPLSVTGVWESELFNLVPHYSIGVMTGSKAKRIQIMESGCDICVINFDGVSSLYSNDKKKRIKKSALLDQFDLIIVDEASAYRNGGTDRWEALNFINTPNVRLWLVTATPTPNAPTDAWALTKLVSPNNVPASFNLFRDTVMFPAGPYRWLPKANAAEHVRQIMQPAIRFEKKDCLDLPPITYNDRYCDMSAEQKKAFEAMKNKMKHDEEEASVSAPNAAVKILKMQQICCGVVKDDDKQPVHLNPKPRLALLLELIEQAQNKVIVFVPFIFSMDMIQSFLEKKGISSVIVNGDVKDTPRKEIFRAFQHDEKPRVLVAHPAVAAHGLTLTAADTIVWYAPIYSLEYYEQANARIERQGQKFAMSVYHMFCHPFESAIYDVLKKKGSIQSALLDLYRNVVEG